MKAALRDELIKTLEDKTDVIVVRIEPERGLSGFRVAVGFRDASSRHYHRELS